MLATLYLCCLVGMLITVLIVVSGCRPSEPIDNRPPGNSIPSQRYIAECEVPDPVCRCASREPLRTEDPRFLP